MNQKPTSRLVLGSFLMCLVVVVLVASFGGAPARDSAVETRCVSVTAAAQAPSLRAESGTAQAVALSSTPATSTAVPTMEATRAVPGSRLMGVDGARGPRAFVGVSKGKLAGVVQAACATVTPSPVPTAVPSDLRPPTHDGKALVVDQDKQVLRVYEDGVEVRSLPASTGKPPMFTPAHTGYVRYYVGTFYSFGLWADEAWYVFTASGEILIHSLPYTEVERAKAYQGAEHLGVRPSSHGCIRLDPEDARWLTTWGPGGVPIVVTPLDHAKWSNP